MPSWRSIRAMHHLLHQSISLHDMTPGGVIITELGVTSWKHFWQTMMGEALEQYKIMLINFMHEYVCMMHEVVCGDSFFFKAISRDRWNVQVWKHLKFKGNILFLIDLNRKSIHVSSQTILFFWKCVSGNSLVQNKVKIKASKAWGRPSLPPVLVRSSITSSKNNQGSTKHDNRKPGASTPARRHYSSWRKSHTDEMMNKKTTSIIKKKSLI